MRTVTQIAELRALLRPWRVAGERIAFVPTMGNLHEGHISLVHLAKHHGRRFVASIFVNPMQFGPNEDFNHYPRTPEYDATMLREAGCDVLFIPDVKEIYPMGQEQAARVSVPGISDELCGAVRPGHFVGVTSVVARLFGIVQPDLAIFGRKDFQQLAIIRRMVADLCMPIEIIGAPTVRADDGLALSSRNQYLTVEERAKAPGLYLSLQQAVDALRALGTDGVSPASLAQIEQQGYQRLQALGFTVDYFAVREANSLRAVATIAAENGRTDFSAPLTLVILAAARLGRARLIDNLELTLG